MHNQLIIEEYLYTQIYSDRLRLRLLEQGEKYLNLDIDVSKFKKVYMNGLLKSDAVKLKLKLYN